MSNLLKKIYAPQDLSLSGSFKASKRFSIRSYLPFWHFSKKAIAWINMVYDMGSIQLFWERLSKNVHVTILKGNMGYDQYTVPDTIDVEPTFVAFLSHSQTYVHGLSFPSSNFFEQQWTQNHPQYLSGIVECTCSDNLSQNSCIFFLFTWWWWQETG